MIYDDDSQGELPSQRPVTKPKLPVRWRLGRVLRKDGRFSAGSFLVVLIVGILWAEVLAMIAVYFVRDWPYYRQVLLDASIMLVIITPLLYFLSVKPLLLKIQQQSRSESIIEARLRLMQYANTHSLSELLQKVLDEIETLTGSTVSFFYLLERDGKAVKLQAWSTGTRQNMDGVDEENGRDAAMQVGIWLDVLRQNGPILHNRPNELHDLHTAVGRTPLIREIVIPVYRDNTMLAVLGLGNKPQDYTPDDVKLAATIADFAWDIVEHKQAEIALRQSEERFRTIADWTYAWEMWLNPRGDIIYTSPASERITGYTPDELISNPQLLIEMIHPDDQQIYREHEKILHDASAEPALIEYRILARDGNEYWLEHVCRPLWGPDDTYLGRRVSNRNITPRKQDEKRILEQIQKERILTRTLRTIQTDIARDLHDTLGQNIGFLRMSLEDLAGTMSENQADNQIPIQNMVKAANESYDLIRSMLNVLQSGYSVEPMNLFARFASQVAERSTIEIELKESGELNTLSPLQIRQLYFIYREALSNIEKHARANRVLVEFLANGQDLQVKISDDGNGFYTGDLDTEDHYGLRFMHQRAEQMNGLLTVNSIPGEGTTITVIMPHEQGISAIPA